MEALSLSAQTLEPFKIPVFVQYEIKPSKAEHQSKCINSVTTQDLQLLLCISNIKLNLNIFFFSQSTLYIPNLQKQLILKLDILLLFLLVKDLFIFNSNNSIQPFFFLNIFIKIRLPSTPGEFVSFPSDDFTFYPFQ